MKACLAVNGRAYSKARRVLLGNVVLIVMCQAESIWFLHASRWIRVYFLKCLRGALGFWDNVLRALVPFSLSSIMCPLVAHLPRGPSLELIIM